MAGAAEGPLGALDRLRQRPLEGDEPARAPPSVGELEQGLFGGLDLLQPVELRVGAERVVDDGLADVDQLTPQPSVIDGAAVFPALMMPTMAVRSWAR